jgi:hypothetical protein
MVNRGHAGGASSPGHSAAGVAVRPHGVTLLILPNRLGGNASTDFFYHELPTNFVLNLSQIEFFYCTLFFTKGIFLGCSKTAEIISQIISPIDIILEGNPIRNVAKKIQSETSPDCYRSRRKLVEILFLFERYNQVRRGLQRALLDARRRRW